MKFEAVIGLEIHAQISTKSKMFCRCDNDSFNKEPNINTCPICMGFPGQLPIINEDAVHKGVVAALALNCSIPHECKFDRKNYFYPDSPKGYQISQYDKPISENGSIEIVVDGKKKNIGVTRLHLEDDAGKLIHVSSGSLVDFNRAGTPLMEIVSEPDIRSAKEAVMYAKNIQMILRYVGSSEADMEKGMMRFDASVSIRPYGEKKLYPRAEIKNLNSFRSLESAITYEIDRQIELWNDDKPQKAPITVGWSDEKQETYFMREKEESDDYRYFPEPDIPPLHFDEHQIEEIRGALPELPDAKKKRYVSDLGLKEEDAYVLTLDPKISKYFEKALAISNDAHKTCSFITTVLMAKLKEDLVSIEDQKILPEAVGNTIELINSGRISYNQAKDELFNEMYLSGKMPEKIIKEKGLEQVSDTEKIEKVCKKILSENQSTVDDINAGKDKAIGFLVGLVMKEMKGQANPQMVNDTLRKLL